MIKPPIILADGKDVSFFSSVASLEHYMESPDLLSYKVFDADGRVFCLSSEVPPPKNWPRLGQVAVGKVKASLADPPVLAPEELERILSEYLEVLTGRSCDVFDLGGLIQRVVDEVGYCE